MDAADRREAVCGLRNIVTPNTPGALRFFIHVLADVDAVLWAGRPGEEGARAVVDALLGVASPGGKLQAQWPRAVGPVGSGSQPFLAGRRGKWTANARTPVDADGRRYDSYVQDPNSASPLFHFRHGLSFTSFVFADLSVAAADPAARRAGTAATVSVAVTNSGTKHAGSTVAQCYVLDPVGASNVVRPWKRLVGFARTPVLAPGASARVAIPLLVEDLSVHDDAMAFVLVPGSYLVSCGPSSIEDSLQQTVVL